MRLRYEPAMASLPFLLALALWEWVAQSKDVAFLAGRPSSIGSLLYRDITQTSLAADLAVTLSCAISGMLIGVLSGFLVGVTVATIRQADRAFSPFINLLTVIPLFAAGPLIVLTAGQGFESKILLSALSASFFAIGLTYQHAKLTPTALIETVSIHSGKRSAAVCYVQAPHAALRLATNARLLFGVSVTGVIIGEFLGSSMGVGRYILVAEGLFDVNRIWAGIVLLSAAAIVIGLGFARIELAARRHLGKE